MVNVVLSSLFSLVCKDIDSICRCMYRPISASRHCVYVRLHLPSVSLFKKSFTDLCQLPHFSVVGQTYTTQLLDEYVIIGNDALFKCTIPSYITDFVYVVSWVDSEGNTILASNSNNGIKLAFRLSILYIIKITHWPWHYSYVIFESHLTQWWPFKSEVTMLRNCFVLVWKAAIIIICGIIYLLTSISIYQTR